MASYKYEVVGADGKPKTGTIEAVNMEVASAELKSGGNTIVSITRANAFNKDLEIHIGKAVSVREMSVFCRQFESVPLLLVYSVFLLLLYFAWVALFAALLALLIYPILKKLRI